MIMVKSGESETFVLNISSIYIVLFLALFNYLGFLKSRKKFYISKKNINFYPKIWGVSLVGALGDGLSDLGLGLALVIFKAICETCSKAHKKQYCNSQCFLYHG